jgi:hypothetical protein
MIWVEGIGLRFFRAKKSFGQRKRGDEYRSDESSVNETIVKKIKSLKGKWSDDLAAPGRGLSESFRELACASASDL